MLLLLNLPREFSRFSMQFIQHIGLFSPAKFYSFSFADVSKLIIPLFMSLYRFWYIINKYGLNHHDVNNCINRIVNLGQINGN